MNKDFKVIPPIKKEFMPRFERFEPLARDSTAIATFKKCCRAYFFILIAQTIPNPIPNRKGMNRKTDKTSVQRMRLVMFSVI